MKMSIDVMYVPPGHIDSLYYSDGTDRIYEPHDDNALKNLIEKIDDKSGATLEQMLYSKAGDNK